MSPQEVLFDSLDRNSLDRMSCGGLFLDVTGSVLRFNSADFTTGVLSGRSVAGSSHPRRIQLKAQFEGFTEKGGSPLRRSAPRTRPKEAFSERACYSW